MIESVTLGVSAAVAYISKDGVEKLLGPTADYLGKSLAEFTQKRVENINEIFKAAQKKLGDKINSKGTVPPKVLKTVLDEGSFASDRLATEYFGGILASSRTETGRDDRGARMAKAVDSMSTYQLRAHYLIYATMRQIFSKSGLDMNMEGRPKMQIYIPISSFVSDMDLSKNEKLQLSALLGHIFFGLSNDGLIGNLVQWGPPESLTNHISGISEHGIICEPSAYGVELFLSAFGCIEEPLGYIFSDTLDARVENVPMQFSEARSTNRLKDS